MTSSNIIQRPTFFSIIKDMDRDLARLAGNRRGETVSYAVGRTMAEPVGASPENGMDLFHVLLGVGVGIALSNDPRVIAGCAAAGFGLRWWPDR